MEEVVREVGRTVFWEVWRSWKRVGILFRGFSLGKVEGVLVDVELVEEGKATGQDEASARGVGDCCGGNGLGEAEEDLCIEQLGCEGSAMIWYSQSHEMRTGGMASDFDRA